MIKRLLLGLLAVLLLLAAALVANTLRQGSRQVVVPALAPLVVDKAAIAQAMAAAVSAKTVSGLLDPSGLAAEFDKLHEHLRVTKLLGAPFEPSKVSSAQSDAYKLIERSIREVFPDALVAPGLVLAATDSRHFQDLAEQTYRFMPIRFKSQDLARVHGTDERISGDQLVDMVRFYFRLLQQSAQ